MHYVCNKTFERPNSQDTQSMPCERMRATTGFPTMMKTAKTSVSQFCESGQGSPVTTWADTMSYMPRSSTNEVANHKHEHRTRVHDNRVGVLICQRLMWNNKPQQICASWSIWKQGVSDDSWNCWQSHCHSKTRLQKKLRATPRALRKTLYENKEGLGPSAVALRATSPDPWTLNPPKKTKTKRNKTNRKKLPKKTFELSIKFLFSKSPFFDNLGQKTRTQKHYSNWGFSNQFLKSNYRSRNGHFWTPKTQISNYHCFCPSLLFEKQKHKKCWNPCFIVF